jgi:hypothetical protein
MGDAVTFAPTGGGPFDRLERRLGLLRDDAGDPVRQAIAFAAATWLPLILMGIAHRLATGRWDPLLARFEVHVRPLVSAPLLFAAEAVVGLRARWAVDSLVDCGFVPEARRGDLARRTRQAQALRDSTLADLAAMGLALSTSVIEGLRGEYAAPLRVWHDFIGLPLFRALAYRWIWRWIVWAVFLRWLSRLDLRLRAEHPDRMGGLEPLLGPSASFGMVVTAMSATLAANWATRVGRTGVSVRTFGDPLILYLVTFALIAVAPLLSFAGPLRRLKRRALVEHGAFAARFVSLFDRAWLGPDAAQRLRSSDIPDVQSLCDLSGGYGVVQTLRLVPVTGRVLAGLLIAGALPMVPLLLVEVPLPKLLRQLFKAAFT